MHNWICHNTEERSKFAKSLLPTKVRLSLLSDPALNFLLNRTTSSVCSNLDCKKLIENTLEYIGENTITNTAEFNQ